MIRVVVVAALLLCAACADNTPGRSWTESGDATYDALKSATDACKAKGGDFQLRSGGDPTHLGDYECAQGKGH